MKIIEIPITEHYETMKKELLSSWFPWCFIETPHGPLSSWHPDDIEKYNGDPYFSHCLLMAPGAGGVEYLYSTVNSEYADLVNRIILDTVRHNKLVMNQIVRINFNMTFPSKRNLPDKPHTDHQFPHNNMLFYFTENGGKTVIQEESGDVEYTPVEDTGIVFGGDMHYHWYPETGRRVVMVVTYI